MSFKNTGALRFAAGLLLLVALAVPVHAQQQTMDGEAWDGNDELAAKQGAPRPREMPDIMGSPKPE